MSEPHHRPPPIERSADDEVERLVRLAGRRPAVPAADAAAVKAAARAEWRRTVQARRQRARFYRAAGALAAAAAVVLLAVGTGFWRRSPPRPAAAVATLEAATGPVRSAGGELRLEDDLLAGAVIETGTGAAAARAALRLRGGASVRLDAGARLGLVSGSVLELHRGAVYVDSGARRQRLEIRTPFGVARNVGTRFDVRLGDGDALRLRVRGGEVILDRDGEKHAATAGVELAVLADGTVERRRVPTHGPAWDWVAAILPPFEIADRPLREVLEWAADEGGWTLRFADAAAAERARETLPRGSIRGLSLEDSVSVLLTASGLRYRLEDGALVVEVAD